MARMLAAALFLAADLAGGRPASGQSVDVSPRVVLPAMSGQDVFRYYCATCHGRDGRGNGGLFPTERVRDFVTNGRPEVPAHGSPDMPVWGPIFSALDPSDKVAQQRIENLVGYIRSLQVK